MKKDTKLNRENHPNSSKNIISKSNRVFFTNYEYDTIGLYIDKRELSEKESQRLISYFIEENMVGEKYKGKKNGFNFYFDGFRFHIGGSFSNYLVGKYNTLSLVRLEEAVERLSIEIGVNLKKWLLKRVDINWNYITKNNVEAYTKKLFLDLSRYNRLERVDGVVFRNASKELEIYNRSKKIKGNPKNWLRVEYRIKKNVNKHIGANYLSDLFDRKVFEKILFLFKKCFDDIKMDIIHLADYTKITKPNLLRDYLELIGIEKIGLTELYKHIDELDQLGKFKNKDQKYYFRRKLSLLSKSKSISEMHPLAKELVENFSMDYENEIS